MKFIVFLLSVTVLFSSCQKTETSGIDLTHMDKNVRPQDDLYRFMNGTWLKEFEIPADKSSYGSFARLADEAQKNLRAIIEEAAHASDKQPGTEQQKVGDLYLSFMDSARVEELGLKPLQPELARIASVKNKKELAALMGYLSMTGVQQPFGIWINQDRKNSTRYISYVWQSGLSLPDKDYYFNESDRFRAIRAAYLKHLEKMFSLAGMDDAAKKARTVYSIEKEIAKKHWTRAENRNRDKTYNKYSNKALRELVSHFDWDSYWAASEIHNIEELIVGQPDYMRAFDKIYDDYSLEEWKTYYTFKLLNSAAPYLSRQFVDEHFAFFSGTLRGIKQNRPRWKRGVRLTEGALGEVVGKIYVSRHFRPEAKQRMKELVENLKESFRQRLDQLDWMSPATKEKAKEKLARFGTKIGYPDKWKDYSALEIKADDLIGNIRRSNIVEHRREVAKLGKPVDRDEWHMYPQTVNAYYSPSMNEIVFPAAILQPPFFNMEADDAVNYGGIGAVIGHELTHGFDDQGRKSDGDGNLTDWWTEEDAREFEKRAQMMVEEYNKFSPIEGMHVNGELTLGENIADLGGLTIAYHAYQNALKGKPAPVIDGFTGEQRFFLGWAQVWARKYREDELRRRLKTDSHSPSQYRTNGVVTNMPEFYDTYNVKEGDQLFTPVEQRVRIW